MAYIENPFEVGNYVICVNDIFPAVSTTGDKSLIGTLPSEYPKKGEVCCIDEILGEFIRFDEYDCNEETSLEYGFRWWKHTHFKLMTNEEVENHYENVGKKTRELVLLGAFA